MPLVHIYDECLEKGCAHAEIDRLRGLIENWYERLTDGRRRMDESEIEQWTDEAREVLGIASPSPEPAEDGSTP
jgi:hypothetical protein|tara:strand:+ start:2283 stop:2504 length:222 start_codon:yes stop_codon:yes gene_type:complete